MKNLKKDNKGFSLVELLVVIAIMVVLVGVVAPTLLNNIEKSKEAKDIQYLDSIASAIQSCLSDEKSFDELSKVTTAIDVTTLYTNTATYPSTSALITSYFAKDDVAVAKLNGTNVTKTGTNADKIMFKYDNGHVIVYVSTQTDGNKTTVNSITDVLKGKRGTEYYVGR